MARTSHKQRILTEGLRVVHERGFGAASVRDIVQAAGVPQGSFTNHFRSKEVFALEILELYFSVSRESMKATLLDETLAPLTRIEAYIDSQVRRLEGSQFENGCLFGNLTAEVSTQSESIRLRMLEIFEEIENVLSNCLVSAAERGDISSGIDTKQVAAFMISSLQGAILVAKAERRVDPVRRCKDVLFSTILRRTAPMT